MGKLKIIRATTVAQSLNTFCRGMLRELSEKYEVIGLSSPGDDLLEVEKREGIQTIAVPMERHISILQDFKALINIVRIFRKERPTMVHSMTPKAGMLCMLSAWLTRVPVRVHTFTGLVFPTSTGVKRRILMFTDWLTCACATHIIPEGEGVKGDLLSNHITKKSLRVLGYGNVMGVDMDYYSHRQEVKDLAENLRDDNIITFVFVGRIVRDKGINELCAAFVRLNETIPQSRLWLVGEYEDSIDPVSEETRHVIKDCPAIYAVGRKSGNELLAYYAAADCFVLPSYREGFPNTVLEAGAMDLPSIVTDINGSREIIVEGRNGIIVQSQNVDALYEAMQRMACDKDARKKMAYNARKMVGDRFEQSFVRKCLYDFYESVLQQLKS